MKLEMQMWTEPIVGKIKFKKNKEDKNYHIAAVVS